MKKIEMGSRSRSGQATIEYLLVIVVIISIAIMFKIINDKYIRPYLNYALGAYIECLLETGQLPFVGSDSSAKSDYNNASSDRKVNLSSSGLADEEVSCRFDSNQINIKAAQEAASAAAGQSGENAKNSGSNTNSFKSNNKSSSSSSSSSSSETAGGGNSSNNRGGPGSSFGSAGGFSSNRPVVRKSTAIGTAEGGQSSTIYIDEGDGVESSGRRRRRVAGRLDEQASKKVIAAPQNKEIAEDKKVIAAGEEGSAAMTKRPVNLPPERRAASLDSQEETSLGLGGLLKLFLIAGIIIAIVVFFGGQIMNYNNSREK